MWQTEDALHHVRADPAPTQTQVRGGHEGEDAHQAGTGPGRGTGRRAAEHAQEHRGNPAGVRESRTVRSR